MASASKNAPPPVNFPDTAIEDYFDMPNMDADGLITFPSVSIPENNSAAQTSAFEDFINPTLDVDNRTDTPSRQNR